MAAVLSAHYRLQGQVLEGVLRRRTSLVSWKLPLVGGEEEGVLGAHYRLQG